MNPAAQTDPVDTEHIPDHLVAARVLAGEVGLFELLMRRYNRRLFRIARGILHDDAEAEDAVQEAYVRAYLKLGQFRGPQGFASWICQIAANEALMRLRRAGPRLVRLDSPNGEDAMDYPDTAPGPEALLHDAQLRHLLERAVDALPDAYRSAFVLREIEQMSVAETADCLAVEPATVKTRVHRARRLLQKNLGSELRAALNDAFAFDGARCDRLVRRVFERIEALR